MMTDEFDAKENLDFEARIQKRRAEQAERNQIQRAKILTKMRKLGVKTVTADYDGYGDSGNVNHVEFIPAQSMSKSTDELEDFIFAFVYQQFPALKSMRAHRAILFGTSPPTKSKLSISRISFKPRKPHWKAFNRDALKGL